MTDRSRRSGRDEDLELHLRVEELEERLAEAEWALERSRRQDDEPGAPTTDVGFAALWRGFVRSTSDFVGIATVDGPEPAAAFVNPAGRRLCGFRADEQVAGTPVPRFHPDWAARRVVDEGVRQAFEQGVWAGESALATPDGEVPVHQIIVAHPDVDGERRFLYTIMRPLPGSRV